MESQRLPWWSQKMDEDLCVFCDLTMKLYERSGNYAVYARIEILTGTATSVVEVEHSSCLKNMPSIEHLEYKSTTSTLSLSLFSLLTTRAGEMSSSTWQDWATIALRPQLSTVIITFIIALTLPLLLHLYIYRSRASTQLPAFLIAGPSGSGKTALTTFVRVKCY